MCGRSFSGKSTIARALAIALDAKIVSLDSINEERGLFGGEGIAVEEWIRTNEEAARRVSVLLGDNERVVVDDISSPRFLRDDWRSLAKQRNAAFVLVYVDTPSHVMRERLLKNRERSIRHDVTDEVMTDHLESFEPPEPDEEHVVTSSRIEDMPTLFSEVRQSIE